MPLDIRNLPQPQGLAECFIAFAMRERSMLFGEFKTKAGRMSPYFFNAGLLNNGRSLRELCSFYASAIIKSGLKFDGLFGPAYKGIPLVAGIAIALEASGETYPYSFNRKETKDHGEGGDVIGAPLEGRILITDDVISAGTSVRESVEIINRAKAQLAGVVVALDRQEKGAGEFSAIQEVQQKYGVSVISIATLADLINYVSRAQGPEAKRAVAEMNAYRDNYGAAGA